MIKDLLQQEQELFCKREVHRKMNNIQQFGRLVDHPELSLGLSRCSVLVAETMNDTLLELETKTSKKRKYFWDNEPTVQTSIELQVEESLPLDWEQCLDLQSGRMYYLNRKTSKKSWKCPKDQKLDLELNISTPSSTDETKTSFEMSMDSSKQVSSTNMVAVACMKCHLLVMLCRSSPSCPNCKYVHSLLPDDNQSFLPKNNFKPLDTLSLLH